MDKFMKFFLAAFVGWMWTMAADVIVESLNTFLGFFSVTSFKGFVSFLGFFVSFVGWFSIAFFGFLFLKNAWETFKS
ncbi:hypothetical protein [Bacillus sp. 165]|uniref:hypothetical protein n=1 Tax=Bacillus sp. 165 TaxID=1529117 RepID=UPI001ADA2F49|nr:hypothetical protein [Bacillus sp. 165]MBO9130382.1 hypothetical protein [Bacillus sp. 165]